MTLRSKANVFAEVAYLKMRVLVERIVRENEERAKAIEELRPEHTLPRYWKLRGMWWFYYHLKRLKFPDKVNKKNGVCSIPRS